MLVRVTVKTEVVKIVKQRASYEFPGCIGHVTICTLVECLLATACCLVVSVELGLGLG